MKQSQQGGKASPETAQGGKETPQFKVRDIPEVPFSSTDSHGPCAVLHRVVAQGEAADSITPIKSLGNRPAVAGSIQASVPLAGCHLNLHFFSPPLPREPMPSRAASHQWEDQPLAGTLHL